MAVTANSMDPNYKQSSFHIPDDFWDEVQTMIDEIDIAFDEELIKLKQQESEESLSLKSDPKEPKILPAAYASDDCEIVGVTKRRSRNNSSSYDSSDSGRKEHRSRRDEKKSKKKYRNRSKSRSLERIKEELRKRLKEKEYLDEIERLEEEKRKRKKPLYEPSYKVTMPDMGYKAVPSTSKDSGYKIRSRSRSRSSERYRNEENYRKRDYKEQISYSKRRSPSPYSRRSRSPINKRLSNSPKRRSRSPYRRSNSPNRSRGRSRSVSPYKNTERSEKRNEEKKKKQSRWSKASPTREDSPINLDYFTVSIPKSNFSAPTATVSAPKANSDDENWDDLVPAKPKTSGAGYNIEEVKTVKPSDFNFAAALYDNVQVTIKNNRKQWVKGKKVLREGRYGYKRGGANSNRTIRIDDDERDVVLTRPEQQKPFMKKSNDKKWEDVMAKNAPLPKTPEKIALPAPPPPPISLIEQKDRAPSEEGELSSISDTELVDELDQPLPPGVEPTEFLPSSVSVKVNPDPPKAVESFPPLPAPPPPPFSILNDDLPPGVDEIEEDTVLSVVKKASNVKKLREIFENLMPERDEDEFLPPPKEFITTKPGKNKEKSKKSEEKSQKNEKNPNITEKNEKSDKIPEVTAKKPDEPSINESSEFPNSTESTEKIPDVNPSKLLPDEIIKEKQEADAIYSRIKESIEKSELPPADIRFLIEEYQPMDVSATGLLYREIDGQQLTIIPESLIEQVINSLHVLDDERHLNEKITTERLTKRYFWPFMSDTIHDFVKNCSKCSQFV